MSRPINVIIPTRNEAAHIDEAVRNAAQLGEVFVLDSLSDDGTQQLARDAGATVVEHAFEGYAGQKNWGIANLPLTSEWVFIMDADERVTPQLVEALRKAVADPGDCVGFGVNRLLIFMGRPIRHGGLFPSWNLRLLKRGFARYEDRLVHEHVICDGPVAYLRPPMLHLWCGNVSQYLAKHIHYADLESSQWVRRQKGQSDEAADRLFHGPLRIRQWLKRRIWPHVPLRPTWRFLYMYVWRLGVLDGAAGWHLAMLMANYEYMITLLYREKTMGGRGQGEADAAHDPATTAPALVSR